LISHSLHHYSIFQTIAAILHIGNIKFAPTSDGCKVASQEGIAAPFLNLISLKTDQRSFIRVFFVALDVAAALLEVPAPKLAEALTVRYNAIKGEGMVSISSFSTLNLFSLALCSFQSTIKTGRGERQMFNSANLTVIPI